MIESSGGEIFNTYSGDSKNSAYDRAHAEGLGTSASGLALIRDKKNLDGFGNLCLISNSKNSRLSNYMPLAKKEHYEQSENLDSIKQRIMMAYTEWDEGKLLMDKNGVNEIQDHYKKMKNVLRVENNS